MTQKGTAKETQYKCNFDKVLYIQMSWIEPKTRKQKQTGSLTDTFAVYELKAELGRLLGSKKREGARSPETFRRETMIYRTHNLTGCLVALQSEASMRRFLRDRQRSVESKMRKAIKAVLRAAPPVADALIEEMQLILALQDSMSHRFSRRDLHHGTSKGASKLQFVSNSIPNAGAK